MNTILSIQAGSNHLAYAVFWGTCEDVQELGRYSVTQHESSYIKSITAFNKVCVIQRCSAVVIAHRPGNMSKLEASLQAIYTGMGLPVVMMPESTRLAQHGLQLSTALAKTLHDLHTAAVRRSASGNLGAAQSPTVRKHRAKLLIQDFMRTTMQAGSICRTFNTSTNQDDLAATVLQALLHAHAVQLSSTPQPALPSSSSAPLMKVQVTACNTSGTFVLPSMLRTWNL